MAEKDASARLRRAVKENNLFLVKRLIQRTDMRNPDPSMRRFTSLAWAAVLGHEDIFEFLLYSGHDDEELSKDADNNTILILLAELKPGTMYSQPPGPDHPDIMGAALRMARIYYERYPFILEWSNVDGKTALHVAALKGNEDIVRMLCDLSADIDLPDNLGNTPLHYASAWGNIPIVQYLIERGCQFAARNHEGFTASDYAYSHNTMSTLQETARLHFESKKATRRQMRQMQNNKDGIPYESRLRSGSGGSRTTATSDSGDVGLSPMLPRAGSSFSSSSSQPTFTANGKYPPYHPQTLNHSQSFSTFSPTSAKQYDSASAFSIPFNDAASVLTPYASRVRERDADAMAEYKKRNRSGSSGTQTSDSKSTSNGISTLPTINGSNSHLPLESNFTPSPSMTLANRRLRPSVSAAQLRCTPSPLPLVANIIEPQTPRHRAGTTPTVSRPNPLSPVESTFSGSSMSGSVGVERKHSARRAGTVPMRPPNDAGNYTGPSSDYAVFPDPPPDPRLSESQTTPTSSVKASARRAALALLSKPLPSIESQRQREHRRGTSSSEVRS